MNDAGFNGLAATPPIATPVSIANGGTGQATANAALNALAALTLGQVVTFALSDNGTNTSPVVRVRKHTTSGTAAAGFGAAEATDLQSAGGNLRRVMTDSTVLGTATDAAEVAKRTVQLMNAGALRDVATMDAGGTALALLSAQAATTTPTLALASNNATGQVSIHFRTSTSTTRSGLRADYLGNLTFFNGWGGGAVAFDWLTGGDAGGNGGTYVMRLSSNGHLQLQAASATPPTDNGMMVQVAGRMGAAKGADVVSATTLTLGVDGSSFGITGTTTVNGITTANWAAGAVVYLKLASGITITHNSGTPGGGAVAIQLKAAANLTTARVTILPLYYDGTFFYEIG